MLALAAFLFWITYRTLDTTFSRLGYILISVSSVNFHLKVKIVWFFICICMYELEKILTLPEDHLYELVGKSAIIS